MKRYVKASTTSGLVGIWWIYKDSVIADLRTIDDGYNDGNFIQYDQTKNHATEWVRLVNTLLPESEAKELVGQGYKSIDRGRVIYNLRTQCYEVTCGDEVYNNIEKRKMIINAFELTNCRADFINLSTHYHIAPLTGNAALDSFEYEI